MLLMYEAIDQTGNTRSDSIEAGDEREARDRLRRDGLYVTRMDQANAAQSRAKAGSRRADAKRKLRLRVLCQITRQLAMLLRAGSGLVPGLSAISRQMQKPADAAILNDVITELQDGQTLAEALQSHPRSFDAVYTAIVAAGEASGSLTEMLERLAVIVGKARALRKKIIGALAYPAVLVVMCCSITNVLLFFVVPRFNVMFTQLGVETPPVTQALLTIGAALQNHWPLIVVAVVGAIVGGITFLRSELGKQWVADVQVKIPIIGKLRRQLILGQVLRTMGVLLDSQVGVLETIELARRSTRNRRFQTLFDRVEESVTGGQRMSGAFERSGLVSPALCQAIHTGEDSGHLGHSMLYSADMLDEDNEELVTIAMKLLEPLILIAMGFVVGAVAIALFVPLFDITSAVR